MHAAPPIPAPPTHRLRVESDDSGSRVVAAEALATGECILTLFGRVVGTPSRYSLQIGAHEHLTPPDDTDLRSAVWPLLNHSCAPNCAVVGMRLVALREIGAGQPVCFNYNATERDIAEPFTCVCGACDGRQIRGFLHLDPREQRALLPTLSPHLADLARNT